MSNNNGFDLEDLVPIAPTPAPMSAVQGQLPAELRPIQERDVLTQSNPKSLINMLPEGARNDLIKVLYDKENDKLFELFINGDESTLLRHLTPSRVDNTLRYTLWTEHAFAIDRGEKEINCTRVYAPVCTKQTWHTILKSKRIFWILLPPPDLMALNRMAYQKGIERLYDILDLPLVDARGKVNAGLANLQLKIVALLDVRLNGPITHKHEITSRNVHVGVSAEQVKKLFDQTMQETRQLAPDTDAGVLPDDVVEIQHIQPHQVRYTNDGK